MTSTVPMLGIDVTSAVPIHRVPMWGRYMSVYVTSTVPMLGIDVTSAVPIHRVPK